MVYIPYPLYNVPAITLKWTFPSAHNFLGLKPPPSYMWDDEKCEWNKKGTFNEMQTKKKWNIKALLE